MLEEDYSDETYEDMPDDIFVEEDEEKPAAHKKAAKTVTEQKNGKKVTTWVQPTPEKKHKKGNSLAAASKNLKATVHDMPVEQPHPETQ